MLMPMILFALVCLLVRQYRAAVLWRLVIEVGAAHKITLEQYTHPVHTRGAHKITPRGDQHKMASTRGTFFSTQFFIFLTVSIIFSKKNNTVLQKYVKFDLSLPKRGSGKKILEEILQLGGEILRRILIVTSLGWKEVYGVEAVKTLRPLSGNTFSRTTAPCIYIIL